mgnify:CR=1 FL=1
MFSESYLSGILDVDIFFARATANFLASLEVVCRSRNLLLYVLALARTSLADYSAVD